MLRGQRVCLRAIERSDLARRHELAAHVELRMLARDHWQPESLARFEKRFEKNLEAEEADHFVIVADDQVIGTCGLHTMNRLSGSASLWIEIGDPAYIGRGYGREAVTLLLDYAFRIQNWRRIWLTALATNQRAIRSYEACGFVHEGRLRADSYWNGQYVDGVLMGTLREEWFERQQALPTSVA